MTAKGLSLVSIITLAFLIAARQDAITHRDQRDWCMEASYINKPVMPADVYMCDKYGIALDNVPVWNQ